MSFTVPQQGFHASLTKSVSTFYNLYRILRSQMTYNTFPILRNFVWELVVIPAELCCVFASRHPLRSFLSHRKSLDLRDQTFHLILLLFLVQSTSEQDIAWLVKYLTLNFKWTGIARDRRRFLYPFIYRERHSQTQFSRTSKKIETLKLSSRMFFMFFSKRVAKL